MIAWYPTATLSVPFKLDCEAIVVQRSSRPVRIRWCFYIVIWPRPTTRRCWSVQRSNAGRTLAKTCVSLLYSSRVIQVLWKRRGILSYKQYRGLATASIDVEGGATATIEGGECGTIIPTSGCFAVPISFAYNIPIVTNPFESLLACIFIVSLSVSKYTFCSSVVNTVDVDSIVT